LTLFVSIVTKIGIGLLLAYVKVKV
jgi:hypothetical protein